MWCLAMIQESGIGLESMPSSGHFLGNEINNYYIEIYKNNSIAINSFKK